MGWVVLVVAAVVVLLAIGAVVWYWRTVISADFADTCTEHQAGGLAARQRRRKR